MLGSRVSDGTILHEILHNLSLQHPVTNLDHFNFMWPTSDDRRFLTEGQIFRAHFERASFLNTPLGIHSAVARVCVPSSGPLNSTCPAEDAIVWPDR